MMLPRHAISTHGLAQGNGHQALMRLIILNSMHFTQRAANGKTGAVSAICTGYGLYVLVARVSSIPAHEESCSLSSKWSPNGRDAALGKGVAGHTSSSLGFPEPHLTVS